ncbi:hypothetical protein BDK51DRAFT_26631 [Blyttiomyces helicus]|uniref:ODAD1 central coiled coil region domain-containing protein n=1 Tax=Blyttiomyces helicus TaxID=388810 RepID=A0A4P9VV86_9FUNG|nr:hypothetical protein BDK51DRAFT_26631 [Blyttiomyces helicus]|eukprot:RKO82715.1 hypothetical protein BDK51DRAFT_26631 [Blyttiomyces helicus]
MSDYEEIMRLVKEATGVSDIHEVLAKFQSQGDTHSHLSQLQRANELRIEELRVKKHEVLQEFEDLRYSGESRHSHSQRLVEEFEEQLKAALARTAEARGRYERVAKLLTNAQAGIRHLYEKLEGIQLPEKTPSAEPSDENVLQVLETCMQKLELLNTNIQGRELPEPAGEVTSILQVSQSALPIYNTRVKLRPVEFEEAVADDEEENDDEYGEVPDRETLKKHTTQMLNARLKSKMPKKVKKKRAAKDEDSS